MTNIHGCSECSSLVECLGSWGDRVAMVTCTGCGRMFPISISPGGLEFKKNPADKSICWRYRPATDLFCPPCQTRLLRRVSREEGKK